MKKIFVTLFLLMIFTILGFEFDNVGMGKSVIKNNSTVSVGLNSLDNNENKKEVDDNKDYFLVKRVVDGDTIVVLVNSIEERIRLIGVNTPETVDPRSKVECFGKEASLFLKNKIEGKKIWMEKDNSQGDRDKYGRLLRYIYLDSVLINKEIIEKGFGYEYTYNLPYKYQKDFKEAQKIAKQEKVGLWADGVCE